jgi:hypothetical protein
MAPLTISFAVGDDPPAQVKVLFIKPKTGDDKFAISRHTIGGFLVPITANTGAAKQPNGRTVVLSSSSCVRIVAKGKKNVKNKYTFRPENIIKPKISCFCLVSLSLCVLSLIYFGVSCINLFPYTNNGKSPLDRFH